MADRKRRLEDVDSDVENSPKRRKPYTIDLCLHNYMCSLPMPSLCQVRVYWVGVYSRWGSIISLSALDWACITNLNGWGCNQEWGSN